MNNSLPSGWALKPLRDITQVVSGGTPSRDNSSYWTPPEVDWVTPTDITRDKSRVLYKAKEKISQLGLKSSSAKLLPAGSLLMTSRATLGEIKISAIECATNQGFKSLLPLGGVDNWFLFYQMQFNKERYESLGVGSTFLEVNKKDTDAFRVLIPPPLQQQKIAKILTTVDNLIEQTQALIDKYTAIKQGMMADLFTRGLDITGTPTTNPTYGQLRPSVKDAPELYKETELGWVPKEWEVKRLGEISDRITSGSRDWAAYYSDEGDLFVRISNLTREHINFRWDSIKYVDIGGGSEGERTKLQEGDILISITADLGIIGVIPDNFGRAFINQHTALARVSNEVNPRFIGHFLASHKGQVQFEKYNDSGAKAGLNLPTIAALQCLHPHRVEQDAISRKLDSLDSYIQQIACEQNKYNSQKKGLMQDLLTGKVPVNA